MTIKKAKLIRLLLRIAFALVGFATPIIIMLCKFDFRSSTPKTRITFIGVIIFLLIVTLLWKFKKRLFEWINSWEYSILKYILIGFSRIYIFLLILIVTFLVRTDVITELEAITSGVKTALSNVVDCLTTVSICQCIAYLVIYPLEQKYDYTVKRLLRKQERMEDYNDAIDSRGE